MEDPRRVRLRVLELETGWDADQSITEPFELHEGERIVAVVPMTGGYLIAYIEVPFVATPAAAALADSMARLDALEAAHAEKLLSHSARMLGAE